MATTPCQFGQQTLQSIAGKRGHGYLLDRHERKSSPSPLRRRLTTLCLDDRHNAATRIDISAEEKMKGIRWSLAALVALVALSTALLPCLATSHAAMDNELSVEDSAGRTLNVQQWDVLLNGVYPLDMNPLSREWFHTGRAVYHVAGDDADDFKG